MFFMRRLGRFFIDQLKGFVATNAGWRFDDLKRHFDAQISDLAADLELLKHSDEEELLRVAAETFWVAPLPPSQTGIAQFTFNHLERWRHPLHLYSPLDNSLRGRYIRQSWSASNKHVHLSGLSQLPSSSLKNYQVGVFVIGNSDHMVPILEHGLSISSLKLVPRLLFYLHDICLHNVIMKAGGLTVAQYHDYMRQLYPDKWSASISERQISWRLTDQLVKANIFGCRALRDNGVTEFVVNSAFAKNLLESDLGDTSKGSIVHAAFHPVFDPLKPVVTPQPRPLADNFLVGSFGVPGRDKHTDEVILAVKKLRSRYKGIRLLISGYGAAQYLNSSPYKAFDWIDISSPDTQEGFEAEISKVDIAIQLRRRSLGESSGVVPTLLAYGIPTLVAKIGAFEEFGAACEAVDPNRIVSVGAISKWIQHWIEVFKIDNSDERGQLRQHMEQYVQSHSTDHFNQRLRYILEDGQRF